MDKSALLLFVGLIGIGWVFGKVLDNLVDEIRGVRSELQQIGAKIEQASDELSRLRDAFRATRKSDAATDKAWPFPQRKEG